MKWIPQGGVGLCDHLPIPVWPPGTIFFPLGPVGSIPYLVSFSFSWAFETLLDGVPVLFGPRLSYRETCSLTHHIWVTSARLREGSTS